MELGAGCSHVYFVFGQISVDRRVASINADDEKMSLNVVKLYILYR